MTEKEKETILRVVETVTFTRDHTVNYGGGYWRDLTGAINKLNRMIGEPKLKFDWEK